LVDVGSILRRILGQRNLCPTNLKGPNILFFIAEVFLLPGYLTIKITTEGLEIKFFISGILL
jgi:hypothetical protein